MGSGQRSGMSHIPLLARTSVPKLQSPPRCPRALCLCLVVTVGLLLTSHRAFEVIVSNATRAVPDPPPQALGRIVGAAARHEPITSETLDDLLVTVGYFARRELEPR